MFYQDFLVGQGVLFVDTIHFTNNQVTESPTLNDFFLQKSNFQIILQTLGTENCLGDVQVLKQLPIFNLGNSSAGFAVIPTVGDAIQSNPKTMVVVVPELPAPPQPR